MLVNESARIAMFMILLVLLMLGFGLEKLVSNRSGRKAAAMGAFVVGLGIALLVVAGLFVVRTRSTIVHRDAAWDAAQQRIGAAQQRIQAQVSSMSHSGLSGSMVRIDLPTTGPVTMQSSGKLWVDDWVAFVNHVEPGKRWLRAESPMPCATEQEAREEALKAAATQLQPYIMNQLHSSRSAAITIKTSDEWVRKQILASLSQDEAIADRHVLRTSRPYGDLWNESVLVDASPATIDRLSRRYSSAAQAQLRTDAAGWAGLAVLAGVIALVYAFLNSATKGYFVWRLRTAALLVLLVAVLVVITIT